MDHRAAATADHAAPSHVWRLCAQGLTTSERRLLEGVVMLSRRRLPQIELVAAADAINAEVLLLDTRDEVCMRWAAAQTWLHQRAVIWLDLDRPAPVGHIAVRRPVQWPTLPVVLSRALEQHGDIQPPKARAQRGDAVLVVDDSPMIRSAVRALLERQGLTVLEAADAVTGLQLAQDPRVACVLMDILMPGMDGYEACRRIKSAARQGSSPPVVVMLTGKSSPFDRIRGKVAGCDAYLAKPVDAAELMSVLWRHLEALSGTGALVPTRLTPAY
jgi:twitching motility two-component system response regulator PilG